MREKLIEIFFGANQIIHIPYGMSPEQATRYVFEQMADYLIANDVVPVVRCNDCKHWKFIDSLNPHWECQIFHGLHDYGYLTGADDFCSYGERKE